MALDPPSIASWPAGPINWAFSTAARAAFYAEAMLAISAWQNWQSSLTLGEEKTASDSRTIYFDIGVLGAGLLAMSMSPPPIHPEPIAADITVSSGLDIAVERASGRLLELLIHEVGHGLGFDHSTIAASIMHNPLTTPYVGGLYTADKTSVAAIYGAPTGGATGITTVANLIYDALRQIGVLTGPGRAPSTDALADGLRRLNQLIGWLNSLGVVIEHLERNRWPLTAAQQDYSIGIDVTGTTTADWVAERPRRIERANLISTDGADVECELHVDSVHEWANHRTLADSGEPADLYYEASHPFGYVKLYPTPDAAYYVDVWAWKRLSRFASVDAQVILPDGYEEMLSTNLAVRLAPQFQRQVDSVTAALAQQSLRSLLRYPAARASQLDPALGGNRNSYCDYRNPYR